MTSPDAKVFGLPVSYPQKADYNISLSGRGVAQFAILTAFEPLPFISLLFGELIHTSASGANLHFHDHGQTQR